MTFPPEEFHLKRLKRSELATASESGLNRKAYCAFERGESKDIRVFCGKRRLPSLCG
jgi:hypothetical protein